MIKKIMLRTYNFTRTSVDIKTLKSFVSNDPDIVVARLRYIPSVLKTAIPHHMSWYVLQLAKKD
jgi:hypothetical protein